VALVIMVVRLKWLTATPFAITKYLIAVFFRR